MSNATNKTGKAQSNKVAEKMQNEVKKQFKNEIEADEIERLPFIKIEVGDVVEGKFSGFEDIDFRNDKGVQRVYKIETEDGLAFLPSNFQLSQKLAKINDLDECLLLDIQITRLSDVKLDGGKRLAAFKVLTS